MNDLTCTCRQVSPALLSMALPLYPRDQDGMGGLVLSDFSGLMRSGNGAGLVVLGLGGTLEPHPNRP